MKDIVFILDYNTYKNNLFETAKYASTLSDKIWFRIKNCDSHIIYDLAKSLREILPNKYLILSERPDIAHVLNYNAVQLNLKCSKLIHLKSRFTNLEFGYSAHNIDEILEKSNYDYYTLSPIFFTKKDYNVTPIGAINVSEINKKVYALGGINLSNINTLKNKGYSGVAGISFLNHLDKIRSIINQP